MKRFAQHFLSEDPDFYDRKQKQKSLDRTLFRAFYGPGGTPKELSHFFDQWRRQRNNTDFGPLRGILPLDPEISNEQLHKAMGAVDRNSRFMPDS